MNKIRRFFLISLSAYLLIGLTITLIQLACVDIFGSDQPVVHQLWQRYPERESPQDGLRRARTGEPPRKGNLVLLTESLIAIFYWLPDHYRYPTSSDATLRNYFLAGPRPNATAQLPAILAPFLDLNNQPDAFPTRERGVAPEGSLAIGSPAEEAHPLPTTARPMPSDLLPGKEETSIAEEGREPDATVAQPLRGHEPLPDKMLVTRAQPAIFKVIAVGSVELDYFKEVSLKNEAALAAAYDRDLAEGAVDGGTPRSAYYWKKIAESPDTFLQASEARATIRLEDIAYSSGTAFAISREGILLTNAHVIDRPDADLLLGSIGAVLTILETPLDGTLERLEQAIGGGPAKETAASLLLGLCRWYAARSRASGEFTQARVVLKYDSPFKPAEFDRNWRLANPGKLFGSGSALVASQIPITAPVKVLATDKPLPGKDVAVLQLDGAAYVDRLIRLPLGDSRTVLPGAKIRALGFRGSAFDAALFAPEAELSVSSQEGEISQVKRSKQGWKIFEMSAAIDHGDSGGPVINSRGEVIAINVASVDDKMNLTLAIPIDVAKELLKSVNINPDVGPLTRSWVQGLVDFNRGDYKDASRRFAEVWESQGETRAPEKGALLLIGAADRCQNPYVLLMLQKSQEMEDE